MDVSKDDFYDIIEICLALTTKFFGIGLWRPSPSRTCPQQITSIGVKRSIRPWYFGKWGIIA